MFTKVGIFYGSTLGNTETIAQQLQKLVAEEVGDENVDAYNVGESSVDSINDKDFLLLGSSTWGEGEIQDDWAEFLDKLKQADFSGKKVALFGTGDQAGYPDTFVDAIGIIYNELSAKGVNFIGKWPKQGYDYAQSTAEIDGMFVGLPLDEDNQPDKTEHRVTEWVKQLKEEF